MRYDVARGVNVEDCNSETYPGEIFDSHLNSATGVGCKPSRDGSSVHMPSVKDLGGNMGRQWGISIQRHIQGSSSQYFECR